MASILRTILPSANRGRSFSHGVHPDDNKHYTAEKPIERLGFPPELYLLLSQHEGDPSVPVVRPRQEVLRGQVIAEAGANDSVPIHAPATGTIKRIDLVPTIDGTRRQAIVMNVYPGDTQEVRFLTPRDVDALNGEEIADAVRDAGIVELGGSAAPTHTKLRPRAGRTIDTVIVNGCESEPYLTTDQRIMIDRTDDIIVGVKLLLRSLGATKAIIAVENNKPKSAEMLRTRLKAIGQDAGAISLSVLKTKYPQGAEKVLVKTLLKREIPSGDDSSAVGVQVFSVTTAAQIGELLPKGGGLIERVITVTGPGLDKPGNYLVPNGTPLRYILSRIGYKGSAKYLINGGPMTGTTVASLDVPVTKNCDGLIVLRPEDFTENTLSDRFPCINCGKCLDVCPVHLNPAQLGKLAAKRLYLEMDEYHLFDCFECGACSYVCPAQLPLVQYFRVSKTMNQELKAAQE